MGDDLEELLPMLVAASKDERLSTGALYSRAASMLEGMSRELAVQTATAQSLRATVERAVETLRAIEGGHDGRLTPLALAGDWHGFTNILQDIARAFLSEIRERKE